RAERITFDGTDNGIRIKANRDRGHDVSDVVVQHITMHDVKHPLVVSEYYPKMLPQGSVTAAPVTRLTPHFHDITIEDVTAAESGDAGVIVGLPESPIHGLVLRNVRITAQKPMIVGYADVVMDHVKLNVMEGQPVRSMAGAKITTR
ncbi:MAG TPA: glycosyl hydrolase family 28 protein, partial [Terracidiphilus sp.]|nr:glycosyl hydrolase family 28 protein [Terracidiphilus sp.]